MRFLVRKRRTTPAVIIVALIDVLIVLVIFLLVTTTFKQQAVLKLALPESSQAKKPGATENKLFVVSIDDQGIYYLEKLPVTFEQFQNKLILKASMDPNLVLAINADEKAPWGKVVKVRDAAAEAKIKTLVANVDNTKKQAEP
jgi:biopolymer transport protein ExbD